MSHRTLTSQTVKKIGETITVKGWVNAIREHGQVNFVDVRDRHGIIQIVGGKELKELSPEDVVAITGTVKERDKATINPDIATGTVELHAESLEILNHAKTLPFPIDTPGHDINESLRLQYRYLDLRRQRLQENIKHRSQYIQSAREYLFNQDFTEIETPLLTKSTKEGSRDFVVPSRLQPGKYFALPQSPQQYKQLLMAAGFERYFQIARALRDEDPRADRGFEHTQIDLELSFVEREDVMRLVEDMTIHAAESIGAKILKKPFPIITYQEAMEKYGDDKFDLRTQEQKAAGVLAFAWVVDFPFFKRVDTSDANEVADGKSGWVFTHNPFSQPKQEHLEWHLEGKNIDQILTTQYDLVCNGYEVSGGSIRAHQPEVLKATYDIMGYSEEEIEAQVGHMLEAFSYGSPPHGGCAQGVERLLMTIFNEEFIREVQAFPQTGKGTTSVMEAPSELPEDQLAELGLLPVKTAENASVYEQIVTLLDRHGIDYKHYKHEPVYTSEEAAEVREDVSLSQGAKALVLKSSKGHYLLVVPGDQRADLKKVREHLGTSSAKLESLEKIESVTGLEAGAIPPFGSFLDMPTLVDQSMSQNKDIVFNAGRHDRSIKMKYEDYIRLEQPEII